MDGDKELVEQVRKDYTKAPISHKLKALLSIAAKVHQGGKFVTTEDVEKAKANDATDKDIHDTVLIAAAFCMFNRYEDGLATGAPDDKNYYIERAKQRAEEGYAGYDANK